MKESKTKQTQNLKKEEKVEKGRKTIIPKLKNKETPVEKKRGNERKKTWKWGWINKINRLKKGRRRRRRRRRRRKRRITC